MLFRVRPWLVALSVQISACGGNVVIGDGPDAGARAGDATSSPAHDGVDANSARKLEDSANLPLSGGDAGQTVALPSLDAALSSLPAPPAGLAGFAFIVNNVVQHPMACSTELWEFPPYPQPSYSGCEVTSPCPGVESVLLVNTGALPMPYLVGKLWGVGAGASQPGVAGMVGSQPALAGVLTPGESVNITSTYVENITALLGSAEPFSSPDAGVEVTDEGTIFWPSGVAGSGGSTVMHVAEIEVFPSCQAAERVW